jgi:hypothetical protein
MLTSSVLVGLPAQTLAAGSYPITGVWVRYYPMYTANTTVAASIFSQGCVPITTYSWTEVAVGCAAVGLLLAAVSNQFSGYWGDAVLETSQVFVHQGFVCNSSKSNCWTAKWEVYARTGTSLDLLTLVSLVGPWGPSYWGYSSVGFCHRIPVSDWQLYRILSGYGL